MSLVQIQEALPNNLILLVGPPGSGKSTFCHHTVLGTIEERPIIYVTTESAPSKITNSLKQKGLGEILPNPIRFVDAFHDTVGLTSGARSDTLVASSEDLTSLGIAIYKLRKSMEKKFLLVFDSLTSPYLMTGLAILRFMKKILVKLAADGNAILACMDEGCGKEEDLVAMMSTADGIVKIEPQDGSKTFNVIKHPKVQPTKIEVPMTYNPAIAYHFDNKTRAQHSLTIMGLTTGSRLRIEVGDYVHAFWLNFGRWSGMLWDPKRFPTLTYNSNKYTISRIGGSLKFYPWRARLFFKLLMPKHFSKVKDMKKLSSFVQRAMKGNHSGILEYLENSSKIDEHYMRVYEGVTCWGFENVGATLALGVLGGWAGYTKGFEKEDRDWNIVETKCIGIGDPYCEFKIVPGEVEELKESLEAIDNTIIRKIHDRLMDRLMEHILHGKTLWERPRMGNYISLQEFSNVMVLPAIASEKYRVAIRLAGVMAGKEVGEYLIGAGIREDEAVQHAVNLLEHCKVGKVSIGETIRMRESCESIVIKAEEPSCFFTTGFLNGFFSAVKNQHIKETKCIAVGDPHCVWEFR